MPNPPSDDVFATRSMPAPQGQPLANFDAPAPDSTPARPASRDRRNTRVNIIVAAVVVVLGIAVLSTVVGPVFAAQRAKTADTNARVDVSTLGRDIATYFVDNSGPPPDITVVDGRYHLDVPSSYAYYNDELVSPGVVFGGISGSGSTDWCVWVSNPNGTYRDFQYSAVRGLEQGSC